MPRVLLLLVLIIIIASLPIINNWLLNTRKVSLDDDYVSKELDSYIDKNLDKIIESIQEKSKYATRANIFKNKISQYKDEIFDSTYPYFGNKNSHIIAVGFFDYSCGHCKAIKDDIKQLIDDGKIKYIFRDTPILGDGSLKAAKSALAVYFVNKEKYFDFHHAALSYKEKFSDDNILNIVQNIGISKSDFNKSMKNNMSKIEQMINNSRLLVKNLGIGGTPFLIIGDSLFVGATDLSILRKKVNELSDNNQATQF